MEREGGKKGEKEGVDKSGGKGWSKEVEKRTEIKKQQGRQAELKTVLLWRSGEYHPNAERVGNGQRAVRRV